jgi:hypothetical protein
MVEEYTKRFYVPCLENRERLTGDDHKRARELAEWSACHGFAAKVAWPSGRQQLG